MQSGLVHYVIVSDGSRRISSGYIPTTELPPPMMNCIKYTFHKREANTY